MTVPIYLAECSPIHLRGRLTVADNMAVTGGQFVAGVVDYAFSYVVHGWRYAIDSYKMQFPTVRFNNKHINHFAASCNVIGQCRSSVVQARHRT